MIMITLHNEAMDFDGKDVYWTIHNVLNQVQRKLYEGELKGEIHGPSGQLVAEWESKLSVTLVPL